jgi:hypothetical protein
MANNHIQKKSMGVSRRAFLGGVLRTAAVAGTVLVPVKSTRAGSDDKNDAQPNLILGGVAPFKPFGIFIHHNPLILQWPSVTSVTPPRERGLLHVGVHQERFGQGIPSARAFYNKRRSPPRDDPSSSRWSAINLLTQFANSTCPAMTIY